MGTALKVPVLLAHGKNMPRGEGDRRVRRGLCWPRKTSRKRLRGGSSRARGREERRDGKWRGGIRQDGDRRWEERRDLYISVSFAVSYTGLLLPSF